MMSQIPHPISRNPTQPQHFLYFFPDPHGHGSFRPILLPAFFIGFTFPEAASRSPGSTPRFSQAPERNFTSTSPATSRIPAENSRIPSDMMKSETQFSILSRITSMQSSQNAHEAANAHRRPAASRHAKPITS